MPPPPAHGAVVDGDGGGWRRGTWWVNRSEYARTTAGQTRKLRYWNSRTEEFVWKDAGRDYYRHNMQKFIINIKAKGYVLPNIRLPGDDFNNAAARNANAQGTGADDPLLRSTFYGHHHSEMILPLTPEGLAAATGVHPTALTNLADLGLVRDRDYSQGDIEAALRANVPLLLRRLPRVNTVDGLKHKVQIDSVIIWVWDESAPITFDEQIFRHVYGQEDPIIETLLDRPLLGLPYIDQHMYNRDGLAKIACMDLTDRGGCVVAQIAELVTKKKNVPAPGA